MEEIFRYCMDFIVYGRMKLDVRDKYMYRFTARIGHYKTILYGEWEKIR